MASCWELRGCDEEMQSRCPHNIPGEACPADCFYTACDRPTHRLEQDLGILLNPDLDYEAAVKQVCRFCTFFLTQGPRPGLRFAGDRPPEVRGGNPNRFLL
ncbi:MAG: hypothetical protein FWG23_07310 [Eggerthellaceae bacterium]|jgi:hypothetical protein|nr:hypothetical protein [Eggerthellaceae bacterium]MDR2716048.1 hypothetical protein [Coriobacteriaceae bacterium]